VAAVGKIYPENGFPGDDGVWQPMTRKEVGGLLNEERLLALYRVSPIANVSKVVTPVILAIGLKDLRVPYYQAKEYYYHLASRNVPCKILAYNDPHAITKVQYAYDAWMNISQWIELHMK